MVLIFVVGPSERLLLRAGRGRRAGPAICHRPFDIDRPAGSRRSASRPITRAGRVKRSGVRRARVAGWLVRHICFVEPGLILILLDGSKYLFIGCIVHVMLVWRVAASQVEKQGKHRVDAKNSSTLHLLGSKEAVRFRPRFDQVCREFLTHLVEPPATSKAPYSLHPNGDISIVQRRSGSRRRCRAPPAVRGPRSSVLRIVWPGRWRGPQRAAEPRRA